MGGNVTTDASRERLDNVIGDLRALRASVGVSYRELAVRIANERERGGKSPAEARIAHTTVSDVFRLGRSRVNVDLIAEVVRALGGTEEEAARWRERAAHARAVTVDPDSGTDQPHAPSTPPTAVEPATRRLPLRRFVILVVVGVLINSTGKFLNPFMGDVFFLDMVGTAIVAVLAGPWAAALTGVLFVATELLKGEVGGALFAMTMVTAGLIWGFGAQRFGLARTLPRFLGLSALVAVVTSAIAVPIIVLYYGGYAGRGLDGFIASMTGEGLGVWQTVAAGNLAVSLTDKIVVGAVAFVIARAVSKAMTGPARTLPTSL